MTMIYFIFKILHLNNFNGIPTAVEPTFIIINKKKGEITQKDTNNIYIKLSEIEDFQEEIFNIDLSQLTYKKLPKELKQLSKLKRANFQTPKDFTKISFGNENVRHYVFNMKSKVKSLPKWFIQLKSIEYLSLVGHNQLNFYKEIQKLQHLFKLKELEIEVQEIDVLLLKKLIQFTSLDKLIIHKEGLTEKERQVLLDLGKQSNLIIEFENIQRYSL
jgi:hypothetical protein